MLSVRNNTANQQWMIWRTFLYILISSFSQNCSFLYLLKISPVTGIISFTVMWWYLCDGISINKLVFTRPAICVHKLTPISSLSSLLSCSPVLLATPWADMKSKLTTKLSTGFNPQLQREKWSQPRRWGAILNLSTDECQNMIAFAMETHEQNMLLLFMAASLSFGRLELRIWDIQYHLSLRDKSGKYKWNFLLYSSEGKNPNKSR